jgi:ABC-type sugar transport system ATPase subunit
MVKKGPVLVVKGLCKYFGGIKAIHNLDLNIFENEIVGIVGDNGAGKSTLIKAISGLYERNAGEIYIKGEMADIRNPNDARRYGIETVYQEQGLIPIFNAASNLFLGREKIRNNILGKLLKFVDDNYMKEKTDQLLENLGIDLKDMDSEVFNLSGGQRQTIVIGRAVYWGGKILIFDEPTNNLGVKQERKVLDLIKKLREDFNISIIIISHNIAHIFELVDRIVVLRNGEIVGERMKNETNANEIVSMITGVAG